MKVQVESVSSVLKKLSVSVPEEDVLQEIDEAYQTLRKQVKIPGFRPGKVPRSLLEKRYGSSVEAEVYENLVRKTVVKAIQDHELEAIAMPEIQEPKREKGEGFKYTASIEVKPSLDPKDYEGVNLKESKEKIKPEQIEEVMKRLQDGQSVLRDKEDVVTPIKGDFAVVTMNPTDDEGNPTSKEPAKDQVLEVGTGGLPPTLEKLLKKMKIGEMAPVSLELSHNHPTPEKGKKAPKPELSHFRVTLKGVKEKVLPELNDEFAKSVGPFENLKALKEKVEEDLNKELKENTKAQMAQSLLEQLAKKNPVDLPEIMVKGELQTMMEGFLQQLQQAGLKEAPEEYSEEKMTEKMRPDAERRVHERIVLEAIAKKENISVDEKEVDFRISQMAGASKVPTQEFRSYYEKSGRLDGLRFQLLAQKTLDFLLSKANIK